MNYCNPKTSPTLSATALQLSQVNWWKWCKLFL
jgi:hypothetical protein